MIAAVYTLQNEDIFYDRVDPLPLHPYVIFIIHKTLRLVFNDLACFLIVWAIFVEKKYLTVSWYLFILEFALLLPLYLVVKLIFEGDSEISSPLLSQIHRLIVNPVLMFLLIMGFFYQKIRGGVVSTR